MPRIGPKAVVLIGIGLTMLLPACRGRAGAIAERPAQLETDDEKTLYALGVSMGGSLTTLALDASEVEIVKQGLGDAASGATPRVDMDVYGPRIRQLADARTALRAEEEKERSRLFLEQATREEGAVTAPSGLIFVEIAEGTGASPQPSDTVRVHYRGTLADGTEFDSSYERGQPAQLPLQNVIPCWTEGLQIMREGGKARLICPSSIAYGDAGRPPVIPPGATLVFEVELLEVNPQ